MIGREALRGIVLEEVLARLLQDNGYKLLVSEHQDPDALKQAQHGLLVRGRGGEHQADVIGELDLPVPFSLPLRLFVEAKFTKQKVGIAVVRNAHGTIHDVNEQYSSFSSGAHSVPIRRYQYSYTLFSASGFAPEAQRYALAQQISLVDLSSSGFAELLSLVSEIADATRDLAITQGINRFPVGQVRAALRRALGTWTGGFETPTESDETDAQVEGAPEKGVSPYMTVGRMPGKHSSQVLPQAQLMTIVTQMHSDRLGDLIVGFPSAPFILVLRIESRADFGNYLAQNPGSEIAVHIEFAHRGKHDGDWVIVPADGSPQFRLVFALPELLADWLLNSDGPAAPRVRDIKRGMLSSIVIFRFGSRLLRLLYEPHRRR
ncbi:restriction endonuclease [Nocardia sp. CDC159]|uniref:Restriction endonuclease n=1 Tax=Nocardia pulmonis TaxID=2951408 RepID=A0A9X2E6C5_9NOCA|nr:MULTISPECIES: restriction endonuclease [Nocardia]MCM6774471.1 restriction endonuclease [Nocardia pulmonis]MCM6787463.1 restriction endonuclease [Nocardia sp. CDC159]